MGTTTPGPVSTGFLEGHVGFIGVPCSPDAPDRRPPCDGPYPDYEVRIHGPQIDTHVPFRTAITNDQGFYRVALPPGEYVIYTQNGILPEHELANLAIVHANETTTLDLVVDTGIR